MKEQKMLIVYLYLSQLLEWKKGQKGLTYEKKKTKHFISKCFIVKIYFEFEFLICLSIEKENIKFVFVK